MYNNTDLFLIFKGRAKILYQFKQSGYQAKGATT